MREWVPVPGTTKGRLVAAALDAFSRDGFEAVGVTDLASAAGVTIGALYHHFGSKAGLYELVRGDVERRVLDRMEGAWAAAPDLATAIAVGFDYLVGAGFIRLVAEPRVDGTDDPIERFLTERGDRDGMPIGRLLAAAWRAALTAALDDAAAARAALLAVATGVSGVSGS